MIGTGCKPPIIHAYHPPAFPVSQQRSQCRPGAWEWPGLGGMGPVQYSYPVRKLFQYSYSYSYGNGAVLIEGRGGSTPPGSTRSKLVRCGAHDRIVSAFESVCFPDSPASLEDNAALLRSRPAAADAALMDMATGVVGHEASSAGQRASYRRKTRTTFKGCCGKPRTAI